MQATDWRSTVLSEVIDLQRGHDLPTPARRPGDVPILGSFGITGWHDSPRYRGPGVTIGRSGASIGTAAYTDLPYWPLNTALFVSNFKGNHPRWVYLLLHLIDFTRFNSGSAQPSLNRNYLKQIPVSLPPLDEQRRIAEVLGALDDLIDTNETTISALGRTADHVFETFDPITVTTTFAEVVDVFGGGTPSTSNSEYWNGDLRWATPTDLTALSSPYLFDTAKKISGAGLAACSSRLHAKGAILMTSRATIGRIAVAQQPTATNQGFIVLAPRSEADRWFLFHELCVRVDEFISRANGSTFLEISRGTFKSLSVDWPSADDRRRLHEQLAPLHEAAVGLERENEQLRRTRDELLPLLMSGAVRVRPEGVAA